MSKILASGTWIVPTIIGAVAVKTELVSDYGVEDIIRSRAISQARIIQMLNTGNTLGPSFQQNTLPLVFQRNTELADA